MLKLFGKDKKKVLSDDELNLLHLSRSGLFNKKYYSSINRDVVENEALIHYYFHGFREKRDPSYLFSCEYYLNKNADVKESGLEPLRHYIDFGEKEGRIPSPFFSISYIRQQITENTSENLLAYFYKHELDHKLSAHEFFDIQYYLDQNTDIKSLGISPYYHFLSTGVYEGRKPREDININEYCEIFNVNRDEENPFLHFIEKGGKRYLEKKRKPVGRIFQSNANTELINYRQPGEYYEEPAYLDVNPPISKVKALAYYLPQFHPFKENDEWWGQGFTEWTNVTRGLSKFNGHYQPHLPKHLGYYDLRVKETLIEQVRYARAGGIYGFCFYHYWFNGKRLMEKPVNILLENRDVDFPFCIMWANENWTRTWDGLENDVLMAQDYLEEDDIPFIKDLGRHFSDHRYIRVDGRPLFFIYRPGIIPNAKEAIQKWRRLCQEILKEEPLFYMAQAFGDLDPNEFGMDGAIEFPPHKVAEGLKDYSREQSGFGENFKGHYPLYDELVEKSISDNKRTEFPLIRGVTPTWDNEARRPDRGMGFIGSTPRKYENWLRNITSYARENPISEGESFVVINAWNEWAEGSHLEPDVYNGAAYLNATYRSIHNIKKSEEKFKLILVGHDAHKHGAQLLTLNIFKTLKKNFGVDVVCILLEGGALLPDYLEVGETSVAGGSLENFQDIVNELSIRGFSKAICNTTVTGLCTKILAKSGIDSISLIHELKTLIGEYSLENHAKSIVENSNKIVFASQYVRDSFEDVVGKIADKAIVKSQGIYQTLLEDNQSSCLLRKKLCASDTSKIIVGSGYADLRKGFDLFVQIAREAVKRDPDFYFVWLGDVDPSLNNWILKDVRETELIKHIHIAPFTREISLYLEGANVFAMTSREDPFPSVVLESLALGTPVVGFEGGGGFVDVLGDARFGSLVPMADVNAFVDAIELQIKRDNESLVEERKSIVSVNYDWNDYVFSLLEILMPELKRVSVTVPNFNYENYVHDRLASIFNQSYPIFELIVLDDKSTDNSLKVINATADVYKRSIRLVVNKENSGSVFKQWEKGASLAKGDYLWIAEADDLAEPNFIAEIMSGNNDFTMAYTDSKQIDENDQHLAENYRYYYDQAMLNLLDKQGIYPGTQVIKSCLAIKNQFMNVSSIVFSRSQIIDVFDKRMDELLSFKVAGDWFVYVSLLSDIEANCKLINKSLNTHRRHSGSVTMKNYDVQMNEICIMHDLCSGFLDVDIDKQSNYLSEVGKILKGERL